jgi:uncharacterized lipoprotein YddW (UPF0748 family)
MKKRLYENLQAAVASVGFLFCSGAAFADYADDMTSASSWVAKSFASGTQAAVQKSGAPTGEVVFECKNGTQNKCTWERAYSNPKPSLADFNALKIKLNISNLAAMSGLTVYLELPASGSSVAWQALSLLGSELVEGEQEITLPFNTMKTDSCTSATDCTKAANLTALTKVWFNTSRYSGNTSDFTVTVDSIDAINLPVALINNDAHSKYLQAILKRYDIGYFTVKKEQLEDLPKASVHPFTGAKFVMANNAALDNASQGTFIANYLTGGSGARFIGFDPTVLQGDLRSALGMPPLTTGPARLKAINALKFTATDAAELVLARQQPAVYSWVWPMSNPLIASPIGGPATPIAYWVSSSTDPVTVTEKPAWLLNEVGAYRDKALAYVYHPLDNDHVLLALMMKLRTDMKAEIAGKVEAKLYEFAGTEMDFSYLKWLVGTAVENLPESTEKAKALISIGEAETAYATAGTGTSLQQLNAFLEARKHLTPAYSLLMRPENNDEVKAIWVTNSWGPQPGDWEKLMADVAAKGFTHVAVNVASAASVSFPSAHRCQPNFPTVDELCLEENPEWLAAQDENGSTPLQPALEDPLAAAISAAHANGLKFIAWKKSFALSGASADRKDWFKSNGFAQYEYYPWDGTSKNIDAATPCSKQVRDLDLHLISEVATNYDVDGIQLDYIRFNSGSSSFDAKCATGFAAYLADKSSSLSCSWPTDVNEALSAKPDCVAEYKTFKKNLITAHVSDVADLIAGINSSRPTGKPEIELSAAVYPMGEAESQDWPAWTGYLDRMFPMTYESTMAGFKNAVKGARDKLPANSTFPLHFGLGGFGTTADIIVGQIEWLRTQQSQAGGFTHTGFAFFELNRDSQENMLPLISGIIAFPDQDDDGVRDDSDDCPYHANTSVCPHGLTASYFNDSNTDSYSVINEADDKLIGSAALARIDSNVDFDWDANSPEPGIVAADYFSVRWTGRLIVPAYTGSYEFCLLGDDGVRLWIDDVDLFGTAHWTAQNSVSACASIDLTAGRAVPIKVEFFDLTEEAIVKLSWSWLGQTHVAVPSSALYAE